MTMLNMPAVLDPAASSTAYISMKTCSGRSAHYFTPQQMLLTLLAQHS
jgi:hypothetical protein